MARGKFITFEGGEGAGKSTQVKKLGDFFRGKGVDVVQTREVGGAPSAEAIRKLWLTQSEGYWDPLSELMLIMAARREHIVKTIEPALARGAWVISDRFVDSTRAYQGIGLQLGLDVVDKIYETVAGTLSPDLTLLLDLPVEVGASRVASRGGPDDRYQQKDLSFHQTLRDAYLLLAGNHADRFKVIDASKDASTVSAVIHLSVLSHFHL